jgi:phage shock protein PspC (stress-responsive transcriptional regulator)
MSTQPSPPPLPPVPSGEQDAFDRIRSLGIVRPDQGRWAAGVASGLAHRLGVDPVLVRGGFVALSIFFGSGLFLYGIGWLLLPQQDGRIHAQEVTRGKVTAGFVGSVIAILSGMSSFWGHDSGSWFGWGPGPGILPLLAVGGVIWWLTHRNHGGPGRPIDSAGQPPVSSTTHPDPSVTTGPAATAFEAPSMTQHGTPYGATTEPGYHPTAGTGTYQPAGYQPPAAPATRTAPSPTKPYRPLTLVTLGTAILASVIAYQISDDWTIGGGIGLGVVGLGLVASGLIGRRGGMLVPAAIVLALTASGGPDVDQTNAVGQRTWAPTTAQELTGDYSMGAGESRIDLTNPALFTSATTEQPLRVAVNQGMGELTLTLPQDVTARVDVQQGIGEIDDQIADKQIGGFGNQHSVITGTGQPVLVVSVQMGMGQVTVTDGAGLPATVPTPGSSPTPGSPSPSAPAASPPAPAKTP